MAFDFGRGREGEEFGPPPPEFRIRRPRSAFGSFGNYNRWINNLDHDIRNAQALWPVAGATATSAH